MRLTVTVAFCVAVALPSAASRANAQEPSSGNTQTQPAPEVVYKIGHGVSPPRATYQPEPEFSEQARQAHYQGTCVLSLIVGSDGKPRDIKVTNPIGMGLDEKALEAVRGWRFDPARKDGEPVAVQILVEVDFHLYGKGDVRIAELTRKAAGGDAAAELELSTAYLKGVDVGKNEALGLMFLEKAARQGLPQAQFLMGEHMARESVPPDFPKAYMWYSLAKRSGYKHSDKALKQLTSKMTSEELQAGQALVSSWTNAPAK
jgi:TonB family protein